MAEVVTTEYPAGTVLPVPRSARHFYVLGRHDCWYYVRIASADGPAACECLGFKHRGRCWHVDRATEFVLVGRRAAMESAVKWFLSLSEREKSEIFPR